MLTNLLIAAALTATLTSAAPLQANISFPFRAASKTVAPGQYDVIQVSSNSPVFALRNNTTRSGALIMAQHALRPAPGDPRPRLVFSCNSGACGLSEIWTGSGSGWAVTPARYTRGDKERLVTVYLDKATGE
jgi:hypothetical protein